MAIAGEVIIKVSSEELLEKSNDVSTARGKVVEYFQNISDIINRTKNYWIGEAGNQHRQHYIDQEDDIESVFARLKEHAEDLEKMAGVYSDAERANAEIAQELPGDVIV